MKKLVRQVRFNNAGPQRGPQAHSCGAGQPFRFEALLQGSGSAVCKLLDGRGGEIAACNVALPGTFSHDLVFDHAGVRYLTFTAHGNGSQYRKDFRLEIVAGGAPGRD